MHFDVWHYLAATTRQTITMQWMECSKGRIKLSSNVLFYPSGVRAKKDKPANIVMYEFGSSS